LYVQGYFILRFSRNAQDLAIPRQTQDRKAPIVNYSRDTLKVARRLLWSLL
jgi:hypothetical protein